MGVPRTTSPGRHGGLADADGDVEAGQGDVADTGGIDAAHVDVDVELHDALVIADAAVDHRAGLGAGGDGGAQVVADHGAADDLAEDIDHHHVAFLQGLDDPGVLAAARAAALGQAGLQTASW